MRLTNTNLEIKEFNCKSDWNKNNLNDLNYFKFKGNIPFFWLIVDQLNQFWLNYKLVKQFKLFRD